MPLATVCALASSEIQSCAPPPNAWAAKAFLHFGQLHDLQINPVVLGRRAFLLARLSDGGGIAGAPHYSLKRRHALGRFLLDDAVTVDKNHIGNLMRSWTMAARHGCSRAAASQRMAVFMWCSRPGCTGTIPGPTSSTCSSGCWTIPSTGSTSRCRTGGRRQHPGHDRAPRRQDTERLAQATGPRTRPLLRGRYCG